MNFKILFRIVFFQTISSLVLGNIIQDEVHVSEQTEDLGYKATTNDTSSFAVVPTNGSGTNSKKSYEYDDSNLWNYANKVFLNGIEDGGCKIKLISLNQNTQPFYNVVAPIVEERKESAVSDKKYSFVMGNGGQIIQIPEFNVVSGNVYKNDNTYKKDRIGIRVGSDSRRDYGNCRIIEPPSVVISPSDVGDALKNVPSEYLILCNLDLFAYEEFVEYARTLPCYEDFMTALKDHIDHCKKFRKKTRNVPGFNFGHSLLKKKSGFHKFLAREVNRIKKLWYCIG